MNKSCRKVDFIIKVDEGMAQTRTALKHASADEAGHRSPSKPSLSINPWPQRTGPPRLYAMFGPGQHVPLGLRLITLVLV